MVRARPAFVLAVVAGVALGGCASSGNHKQPAEPVSATPKWTAPLAAPVMPGEAIVAYQNSLSGTLPFERFEFSRNNERLSYVRQVPIEATRQWPEPPRPRERPVIFQRWRQ